MKYCFTLTFLLSTFFLIAQSSFWTDVDATQIALPRNSEQTLLPTQYRAVSLELDAFTKVLARSPEEFTNQKGLIISLPMPDGTMEDFEIWESTILEAGLAKRYPTLKTFKGQAIKNPQLTTRLGYTPLGFHGMIQSSEGAIFIDPLATNQTTYYTSSYAKHGTVSKEIEGMTWSCGSKMTDKITPSIPSNPSQSRNQNVPVDLYIYRAAIASTGEYAAYHNATTKEEILARYVSIMNRANMIFETDLAIRMVLIDNTDQLIFLDAATDPYENGNNLVSTFSQNPMVVENIISRDEFDIGHVFIANCSTGGGAVGLAALGSACEANKTLGSSCQFYNDARFAIELVCHEMGHQLAASHSWANCPNAEGQISTGTAFEPGSGSTIMSYSGACGSANNIQNAADDYFHGGNIEQMLRERNLESSCANIITTNNNQPVIDLPYEDGFFIPISTPFILEGVATDEDGDALTYAWEQMNTGPAVPLGEPLRTAPTFRSFPPSTSPDRTFPKLTSLINNRNDRTEVLPTYERNLTFRLTVRDNNPEAGGIDWQDVSFEATEEAGPFLVTFPNQITDVLNAGAFAEITWDVAGTNTGRVNCQKVNILLSTNRGISYDHVLVENTDNDGSQSVTIPDVLTDRARIKVEAADNIFFDISNQDISILSPTSAGFSFATSIQTQQVCLPATLDIDLTTFSLLGFNKPIAFSGPVSEDNSFITVFTGQPVSPGNTGLFSITFPADYPEGEFSFDIIGVAEGVDTIRRTINLDLVSNQFTDLTLAAPSNNTSGVGLPIFQWTPTIDADLYEVEIATNPSFGDAIIDKGTNIIGTTYTPSITLNQSTIYYWRVNPINDCGVGINSQIFAFQTQNLSCTSEAATDIPILISSIGTPTVESKMTVTQNFEISDLNIPKIRGSHDWVSHIRTTLISPVGTSAIIFERKCPGSVPFDLGFDDESPMELPCPPIGGPLVQPKEPLSVFDGESTFGEWTLQIEVTDGFGEGGALDEWSLEFCGNLTLDAPTLVTNEVLPVKPKSGRLIDSEFLLAQDANNSAEELIYTLVETPTIGSLLFNKEPIAVGAQFTQADLNNGAFKYRHDTEATEGTDQFTFTLSDGEGGWIGITPFQIVLDASETTVGIENVLTENLVKIYPNPAKDYLQLDLTTINSKNALVRIFDVQGKLVYQTSLANPNIVEIITADFNNGLYFLQLEMDEGVITKKLVVQR